MFEDSLLESQGRGRTRRPLTVAISVLLQLVVLGLMVLAPLFYAEALPQYRLIASHRAAASACASPPSQRRSDPAATQTAATTYGIRAAEHYPGTRQDHSR